jgi:hypothetical protein
MTFDADTIYGLLPAVYRIRDTRPDGTGGPVKGLVRVIAHEVAVLEESLAQLYDDEFIETCAEWVVPYIGDLLGVRALYPVAASTSLRSYVANTLRYRARKGTVVVLEQVAADVTGWSANVAEEFRNLAICQHMQDVRPSAGGTVDLRKWEQLERIGTGFDTLARLPDVRRVESRRGLPNLPNIAVFLWRLYAHTRTASPAAPVDPPDGHRYRFSPLGIDVPLYTRPVPVPRVTQLSTPVDVPIPLSRRVLAAGLSTYYGAAASISVQIAGTEVPGANVEVCNLQDVVDGAGHVTGWAHTPTAGLAIDPVLGRLAFADDQTGHDVTVTYASGFADYLGGGEYERGASFTGTGPVLTVRNPPLTSQEYPTIQKALDALGATGTIVIQGSGIWTEDLHVDLTGRTAELRAVSGASPILRLTKDFAITGNGQLTINGLIVTGAGLTVDNHLDLLAVRHCTFVPGLVPGADGSPGAPSITVTPVAGQETTLTIDHCITGPVRVASSHVLLNVQDSILDPGVPEPLATTVPALVSAELGANPDFSGLPPAPAVGVAMGTDGPHQAQLAGVPADLADAASKLQSAIRAAGSSPSFTGAQVLAADGQLIIVPGGMAESETVASVGAAIIAGGVTFTTWGDDPTASLLGLQRPAARRVYGLLGTPLAVPFALRSPAPTLLVAIGGTGPLPVRLASPPADADAAAADLQAAIRAASAEPGFSQAAVAVIGGALLVIPGADGQAASAVAAPGDAKTADDLGLASAVSVIAGSFAGDVAGPVTGLARCTVLGPVHVSGVSTVSDSLLLWPLTCERRQVGCVRFSLVAADSLTPRRYRCQSSPGVTPVFTSLRYGDPGYCQLRRSSPDQIWRGASDNAEMGALHELFEPQRETNLLVALDEYLRFALQAGIFYAT